MKNWARIIAITFAVSALAPTAQAQGDICEARPDLCGGAPLPKKKKAKKARKVMDYAGKAAANCRKPGEPFNLDGEDLPICGTEAEDDSELALEPASKPKKKSRPRVRREEKSEPATAKMDFDSYMQNNRSHPAISRRPSSINQTAFERPVQRATITGSTLDTPDPAPAAPAVPGNAAPSVEGADTPPPAPNQ